MQQVAGDYPENLGAVHAGVAGSSRRRPPGSSGRARRSRRCGSPRPPPAATISWSKTKPSEFIRKFTASSTLPAEGAVAGVVLGQAQAEGAVLHPGEEAVGHVLPPRHPLLRSPTAALEPRAEHQVGLAPRDGRDDLGHQGRIVLVVGMDHHHDVGARRAAPPCSRSSGWRRSRSSGRGRRSRARARARPRASRRSSRRRPG